MNERKSVTHTVRDRTAPGKEMDDEWKTGWMMRMPDAGPGEDQTGTRDERNASLYALPLLTWRRREDTGEEVASHAGDEER